MRIRTSLVALAVTAAGFAATATPATATQHGGDSGATAIAIANGAGSSATANAIKTGPIITTTSPTTPPDTGTPGTSTLLVTSATLSGVTVSVDISYSCPSGLPADTELVAIVNQSFAGFGSGQATPTCDGNTHVAEIDVTSGNSTPFAAGAVIVTGVLDSPSDQNGPFAQDELFTSL
ncbi:hypothetical protein EES43_00155 [Streptomyces sp. ADI96-02]|uniref:hypothetical protein n=1 Tax=unclassified Streptomyces TaxID=2593676 RepID=UPI000F54CEB1|nr:hypothetical protein [Streptomyces sp. ADI96-02]RPK69214.1 hypothetical protein EES43_00155 [Streptomyces sp. ADI96-02]